jgi:gliding motility-associated-like protein
VAKKDVYLLMYPKYFTPNADGYNDYWEIQFYQNELHLVVKIFDRFGKFIKQLTATDPIWDGTYKGNNLPATDYWFTVIRENGTEYKGHFSLKR